MLLFRQSAQLRKWMRHLRWDESTNWPNGGQLWTEDSPDNGGTQCLLRADVIRQPVWATRQEANCNTKQIVYNSNSSLYSLRSTATHRRWNRRSYRMVHASNCSGVFQCRPTCTPNHPLHHPLLCALPVENCYHPPNSQNLFSEGSCRLPPDLHSLRPVQIHTYPFALKPCHAFSQINTHFDLTKSPNTWKKIYILTPQRCFPFYFQQLLYRLLLILQLKV